MTDSNETLKVTKLSESPLVFISHDSRDEVLAESFSKLLRSVSGNLLKSFRSSDKSGKEGIEFGDEWYKTLMTRLSTASDVVCLLTERSLERPWILYEAGVAKGKLDTPVHGLALGISLSSVSTGPFYQFQNCDDSPDSLYKLTIQLCKRIQGLEPDIDVVKAQVKVFKESVAETLKNLGSAKKPEKKETVDEGAIAKVLEEMKLLVRELPFVLEKRIGETPERVRPIRYRRIHPGLVHEMGHFISRTTDEPIGILVMISFLREDFPWLYELGVNIYRTLKQGKPKENEDVLRAFRDATEFTIHGPLREMLHIGDKESFMLLEEMPRIIEHFIHSYHNKPTRKRPNYKDLLE